MRGLILAAGFGTRMGCRPKAFLPVGGSTALDLAVRALESAGIASALVVHNARWSASFDRWWRTRPASRIRVDLLNDGAATPEDRVGATGDLLLGLAALGSADAVLMAVDNVITWPLAGFLEAAGVLEPAIAVRRRARGHEALGGVDLDMFGHVQNWYEGTRPGGGRAWSRHVWLGPASLPSGTKDDVAFYCEERRANGEVPDSLGGCFAWLARRRPVRGIVTDGGEAWDVGTPGGLAEAQGVLGP